jgi:hypothetical protein
VAMATRVILADGGYLLCCPVIRHLSQMQDSGVFLRNPAGTVTGQCGIGWGRISAGRPIHSHPVQNMPELESGGKEAAELLFPTFSFWVLLECGAWDSPILSFF